MEVFIRNLNNKASTADFYEWALTRGVMKTKIKETIRKVLIDYGKVGAGGDDSLIDNLDKISYDIHIKRKKITFDTKWGRNSSEMANFDAKIEKMRYGSSDTPSVDMLTEWVKGKRKFFAKHPEVLSTRAWFYNNDMFDSDREYAEMLQDRIEERGNAGGRFIFRGQSKAIVYSNPFQPIYTVRQVDFYEKMEIMLSRLLRKQFNKISLRMFQQYLAQNKGNQECLCLYDNPESVNITNFLHMSEKREEYWKMVANGKISIEGNIIASAQSIMSNGEDKARELVGMGSNAYNKAYRSMSNAGKTNSQQVYSAIKRTAINSVYKSINARSAKIIKTNKIK